MTSWRWCRFSAVLAAMIFLTAACSFSKMHPSVDKESEGVISKKGLVISETHGRLGCGLNAVVAARDYFGITDEDAVLSERMRQHLADGSTPVELLLGAREAGLSAQVVRGTPAELERLAVDHKTIPVIMMDASLSTQEILRLKRLGIPFLPDPSPGDLPHWLVVAGIQEQKDKPPKFLACGPEQKQYAVPQKILIPRWEKYDYCLIILSSEEPNKQTAQLAR